MENTMLAAYYDGTPEIKLEERPLPEIGPKEMLLEVKAAGICGTDLRILRSGHRRIESGTKRILGHELSGVVHAVGKEVAWPQPGMRICLAPNMGCGHCENCIQGYTQLCENYYSFGVVIDGAFAQYMKVPAGTIEQGNISQMPDNLSFVEASLIEPLSCAYHGYMACKPNPGESVLIVGVGAIGLMFVQLARALGAGRVIVSSHSDLRSEQAVQFGADCTFNPKVSNFKEEVLKTTNNRGVDIAVIAAPSGAGQTNAVEIMAHHGRINFFGGLPKGSEMVSVNSNLIHYKELTITGTTGSTKKEYRTSLSLVERKIIEVKSLASKSFPLKNVVEAFEYARSKQGLKTIVLPND